MLNGCNVRATLSVPRPTRYHPCPRRSFGGCKELARQTHRDRPPVGRRL